MTGPLTEADDRRWMDAALRLARRGLGQVWPNPAVACLMVRDGRLVGRGVTAPGGRPHAEVVALAQAGAAAQGATAYVTLEPCAHTGQTGPCAQALIDAGVARVVVAITDPDPRVAGRGLTLLRDAGVVVTLGPGAEAASALQQGFLRRVTGGRPWLTLKLATSLDGRIATASGESQWITGPAARARVHALRASHDAVMIGAGTARADDPQLTVRGRAVARQPVRVVLSRSLNLTGAKALRQSATDVPLWLLHGPDAAKGRVVAWAAAGAKCHACALGPDGQIDVGAALDLLAGQGVTRVFCEGGGALAASLVQADLVDELQWFTAGLALGAEGQPGLGALGVSALAEAPRLILDRVERVGDDVLHRWVRP